MRRLIVLAVLAACGRAADPPADSAPLPVREGFVTTPDSVRLYYRVVGSGPETVLVPNALFHRERLDVLAGATRRLVLYDPRGRGRSDSVPAAKATFAANLADVDALRLAVGADLVALIGWSGMGMELFVYTLRNPGRVTRLIQLAPVAPRWIPYADSLGASRAARTDTAALARLRARAGAGEFAANEAELCREEARLTTPASFGDTTIAGQAPDVCEWSNEWPSRIRAFFGAFFETLGEFDWRNDLSRVTVPRLVVHGELDNTPLAGNCEWVHGQPAARLLVVRGAGHWPQYERPDQTLPALRAFLDGRWPEGIDTASASACPGP